MWFLLSSVLVLCVLCQGQEMPIVSIGQGTVVGSVAADGSYLEFYGIPYADSTSGSNRFKAPSAPPSFSSNFIASRKDIQCVHATANGYDGVEDCLIVDVYTPSLANPKPVVVWINGKEFRKYDHDLSFRTFVEKDVVVVKLNFRESILGFLCLGTETAPGNAGLKDIIAGLRWIQTNIASFGGDPSNVSILGHGSGASLVDLVSMSRLANGLVHKAISQSGTALAPWAVTRNNLKYAIEVAEALGHDITSIEALSEVFTKTSIAAMMAIINELDLTDNAVAFAPCIENPDLQDVEPFLIESPFKTLTEGTQLNIPFMTGFVDNEGTIRYEKALGNDQWLLLLDSSFPDFLQSDLAFDTEAQEEQIAERIKTYYFGSDTIDHSKLFEFVTYQGDTIITVSALREARLRAASTDSSVFIYQFSYKGLLGDGFSGNIDMPTASHGEELAYLYNNVLNRTAIPITNQADLMIADVLIERWTNFAKTGNPTSETSSVTWLPYTTANNNFIRVLERPALDASSGQEVIEIALQNPQSSKVQFWDAIYEEHFLDAASRWRLSDREDDSTTVAPDTVDPVDPDTDVTTPTPDETTTDPSQTDSASTAIGYTFSLMVLFSILNKFHSTIISS